jgi:prepilin signal peptidase PulO-like enzyme (type II secretory pathway)
LYVNFFITTIKFYCLYFIPCYNGYYLYFLVAMFWVLWGVFSAFLLVLSWIDFKTLRLPDKLTLSLLWLGLGINAFSLWVPAETAIIGAIAAYLSFFGISQGYVWLRNKEGLGLGDAKLLAAIGAWLGWQVLPAVVLSAASLNLFWALICFLRAPQKKLSARYFPFGPALAMSAIVTMTMQLLTLK